MLALDERPTHIPKGDDDEDQDTNVWQQGAPIAHGCVAETAAANTPPAGDALATR